MKKWDSRFARGKYIMKTLPIINLTRYDEHNALLRNYMRQTYEKKSNILFITPPEQKQETIELISEKKSAEILNKIKHFNKEIFGK